VEEFRRCGGEETGRFRSPERVTFSGGEKVTKKPLETKVSRLPLAARFYKAKGGRAPFDTLFVLSCTDTAMCRLPGGAAFRRAGCLPRTFLRGVFRAPGAPHFAHGGKVGKTPPETKVSGLPFSRKIL